jgi:hypothetical protein
MLDRMIQDAFDQMADADQPPARVSVSLAMRHARVRRRNQRLTAAGAPIFAAGAALAIALSGALVSGGAGPAGPSPAGPWSQVPPRRFNPLVPYAAATWLPDRNDNVSGYDWTNAVRLIGVANGSHPSWTSIWVYAADQCVLTSSRLSCGSTANGTGGVMTVSGRAPDVKRHAAYWISHVTGDMDIPPGVTMVAFRYAPLGWAVVESTSKAADAIRVATELRYGQTSHPRFPVRLTGLPPSWRDLQQVSYYYKPYNSWTLFLGTGQAPADGVRPDSLTLQVVAGKGLAPACNPHNLKQDCRVTRIDGDQVYLGTLPAVGGQPVDYRLTALNADGLSIEIDITGPDAPMSPAEFFAHHLQLLGPNPADWTTRPLG